MKKKRTFLFVIAVVLITGSMYAQKTVQIEGRTFIVRCNNDNMTAEICDYDHRVDDREFPMYKDSRRFKNKLGNKILNIPKSVVVDGSAYTITSIGRAAFADFCDFQYVIIPNTVNSIGEYAFFRTALVEVEIPASVLSIGNRAFGRCAKLKSLLLPYNGIKMGDRVYAESKNAQGGMDNGYGNNGGFGDLEAVIVFFYNI